jgi:hypothetical protein
VLLLLLFLHQNQMKMIRRMRMSMEPSAQNRILAMVLLTEMKMQNHSSFLLEQLMFE